MPYSRSEAKLHARYGTGRGGCASDHELPMLQFCLPDLAECLQEAEIVAWHVSEGDRVVVDHPVVSVETEKAVVEIPSPHAGHIARLLARAGERSRARCSPSGKDRMPTP